MPTNSDVVLIISQYETAMNKFKTKFYIYDNNKFDKYGDKIKRWMTKEHPIDFYVNERK